MIRSGLLLGFLLCTILGPRSATAGAASPFVEVTDPVGIDGRRQGDDRAIGQAWGDFDNDGWVDLYLTDTRGPNRLWRNVNGIRFEQVDDPALALADAYSGGAIFADFDNDGWQDLYVLNWGPNQLLHNDRGKFVDVTAQAGVGGGDKNSQTASWGDYDSDGLLDLYVANWACYGRCGRPTTGDVDRLYHNLGDGRFEEVTSLLGTKTEGAGFVASWVDYDNDGDSDIYVVNDEFINPVGNVLWRNDGPGCDGWCFHDVSADANADARLMGMGLATADFDRDGDLDLFFSNAGPMQLLRNQGDGTFNNVAAAAGVEFAEGIGWGSIFFDYDNDGWQDLYVAIMEGADGNHPGNPLFRNRGDGTFEPVAASGAQDTARTLGVATADYNRDGRVDMVIGNIDSGYRLLRNTGAGSSDNRWLSVILHGDGQNVNRDAIGARVTLSTADGRRQMQQLIAGSSLGAGNELALHFGLGQEQPQSLTIDWPDGTQHTVTPLAVNQRHEITYGQQHPAKSTPALLVTGLLIAAVALWQLRPQQAQRHQQWTT